jgi:RimJ/RimL family protein N-acetyltransferase
MEPHRAPVGQPVINRIGEKVALGPLSLDLLPLVHNWFNDFEVRAQLGSELRPVSFEVSRERFERTLRDETKVIFCIYERSTMRPIGMTSLEEINRINSAAEFDIRIGEKDCWGKGYGTETTRLMLDYGFTCLGLHSIRLVVLSYNERAIRAYTRAGFKHAGRIREAWRLGSRTYDLIQMDCLANELQSPVLFSLLPKA